MQVFLDTYATSGVDAALAAEASTVYSPSVFARRLADPAVELHVVQRGAHAVGFIDLAHATACPVAGVAGTEVFRLYVQRPFQRQGIGQALLAHAAGVARGRGQAALWLTAWSGNTRALAFYAALGWRDVGETTYVIDGVAHPNRVLVQSLTAPGSD
jgi:ribosomal protein S18 acetylase RimI-like enzyme